jgi:hypothetical protein
MRDEQGPIENKNVLVSSLTLYCNIEESLSDCTYRAIAAVVIVGLIRQTVSDSVVHLLVIGLGGDEGPLGGGLAVQVEVCSPSTKGTETKSPEAKG